jgi:DNA invertase Pin-like site-specific DNA recombinase
MLIGYARVSTDDQKLNLQQDALHTAGCEKIFEDYLSGARATHPGLTSALAISRAGDILVVWRLDRLGRSLKDLIQLTETLKQRSIGLQSLQESIDTTTSSGQLIFHLFGALAEFERNLIRERTNAGLVAASLTTNCMSNETSSGMARFIQWMGRFHCIAIGSSRKPASRNGLTKLLL